MINQGGLSILFAIIWALALFYGSDIVLSFAKRTPPVLGQAIAAISAALIIVYWFN